MADKVVVYRDKAGSFRWRRVASNGDIVADSGEGYSRRSDAQEAALRENEGLDLQGAPEPDASD